MLLPVTGIASDNTGDMAI